MSKKNVIDTEYGKYIYYGDLEPNDYFEMWYGAYIIEHNIKNPQKELAREAFLKGFEKALEVSKEPELPKGTQKPWWLDYEVNDSGSSSLDDMDIIIIN